MRNLVRVALSGLFISSLALTACGDDDPKGSDTTQPDTTQPDTAQPDTTAGDLCNNASDLAVLADNDAAAKASACAADACITDLLVSIDAYEPCVQTCMLNADFAGYEFAVSAECSSCYTKSVRCTAEFCGLNDPNKSCVPVGLGGKGSASDECNACRAENGCVTSFVECSGLTPTL